MRVGFKVVNRNIPVQATITGNILPVAITTDSNGEAFAIAPISISPAKYFLDIVCTCPRTSIHITDIAEEIENYYTIDLRTKKWKKETLSGRIGGDGFYKIDNTLLKSNELIISNTDPMLRVSNCALCLYFNRIKSECVVNGNLTPPIPITNPIHTTSRLYYPAFLPPSYTRIQRDFSRLIKQDKK